MGCSVLIINIMKMKGFVFTSDTHSVQLVNTFSDLLKNNVLTDVTLVGDDRARLEAHKIVLCAGSSMFRDFFVNNAHAHPMVYLKGVKQQDLLSLVQFLYYGETTISKENLNCFLKLGKELEISGLDDQVQDICEETSPLIQKHEPNTNQHPSFNYNKVYSDASFSQDLKVHTSIMHEESESHLEKKEKEVMFNCIECHFSGASEEALRKHKQFLHDDRNQQKNVELDLPKEKLTATQTSEVPLLIGCANCSFTTRTFAKLRNHSKNIHSEINVNKDKVSCRCMECGKKYSHPQTLKDHHKQQHEGFKIGCNECNFVTTRPDNLRGHILLIHEKKGAFNCDQCDFHCMRPGILRAHMSQKHAI